MAGFHPRWDVVCTRLHRFGPRPAGTHADKPNIIVPQGLGPLTLRGSYDELPVAFWGIVTGLSIIGGALLVRRIVASLIRVIETTMSSKNSSEEIAQIFFIAAAAGYAAPILVFGFYDRYLIPLLPCLLYMCSDPLSSMGCRPAVQKLSSAVMVSLIAAFAVVGTRDYLTWNRTRWAALDELASTAQVNAHQVDGGFEYNGWFLYDPRYHRTADKSLWWVEDDKYMVAFQEIPGFLYDQKIQLYQLATSRSAYPRRIKAR